MSRIATRFAALKKEGRGALIPFLEAWDPDAATSMEILRGMPGAGADLIEIGRAALADPDAPSPLLPEMTTRQVALLVGVSVNGPEANELVQLPFQRKVPEPAVRLKLPSVSTYVSLVPSGNVASTCTS